jgi:endonuclease-3
MPLSSRSIPARRERLFQVLKTLQWVHGPPPPPGRGKCLDLLDAAMLSQNTNLANASSGYKQLRRAFGSWTQVMEALVDAVKRAIAVCGLGQMRVRRLQSLLRVIKSREGKLDLRHLGPRSPDEASEYLTSIFGIGPKTAAWTLLFAFDMPFFPVDKSIHRMSRRLRLVRAKACEEDTARVLARSIDPSRCYPLHALMFAHAKAYCRPRNPKCNECQLLRMCPSGQLRIRHRRDRRLDPPPARLARHVSAGLVKHGDAEIES